MIAPHGELLAEIHRPVGRFGLALHVARRPPDGGLWVASVGERGELEWEFRNEHYADTVSQPLLYLDDQVAEALRKALNGDREQHRGPEVVDAVTDSCTTRSTRVSSLSRTTRAPMNHRIAEIRFKVLKIDEYGVHVQLEQHGLLRARKHGTLASRETIAMRPGDSTSVTVATDSEAVVFTRKADV